MHYIIYCDLVIHIFLICPTKVIQGTKRTNSVNLIQSSINLQETTWKPPSWLSCKLFTVFKCNFHWIRAHKTLWLLHDDDDDVIIIINIIVIIVN